MYSLPIPYPIAPNTIYNWDALTTARTMRASGFKVNCVVTSPPYFGLRDYQTDGQLGLESTPDAYVRALVDVFRAIRDVLTDDGVVFLNLGDSYANDGKWGGSTGLKHKDLIGIPWRVAFALQADGWYLRSDIIWVKRNCMPESVTDRPTKAHEYLFLLTKRADYWYDAEAIADKALRAGQVSTPSTTTMSRGQALGRGVKASGNATRDTFVVAPTRNKRSWWDIPTQPFPGAHFAVMPEALVEPCILAGCPVGGVVFDPFMGSGTVARVARRLGRAYVGSEINADYVAMARETLRLPFEQHYTPQETDLSDLPLFAESVQP